MSLKLLCRNSFKRPVSVVITVDEIDEGALSAPVTLEGDVAKVAGVVLSLAEVAWNEFNWRPQHLVPMIANVIAKGKIPKEK